MNRNNSPSKKNLPSYNPHTHNAGVAFRVQGNRPRRHRNNASGTFQSWASSHPEVHEQVTSNTPSSSVAQAEQAPACDIDGDVRMDDLATDTPVLDDNDIPLKPNRRDPYVCF